MKDSVIVLGGDGFCGWPTSLYLSKSGYDVVVVDNLSRRKIDIELECESLTPIAPMSARLRKWRELSGREIEYYCFDVANHYHRLLTLIEQRRPRAIVHFAEQRAAPYSMKSSWHKRYTVNNNLNATHNVLAALVESGVDAHLVHLGTTGVYGYGTAGMEIPEGYLKVRVDCDGLEKEIEIMYPPSPGSVYHTTKTQDALFFLYYNRNDGIRITDLHQGIVWGTLTDETAADELLINRFDYDGDYGTVLNRFLIQAAVGHPLTVHGTGGQTRAFINIRDTVKCVRMAIENPPARGAPVKIFNQTTECHNVLELAKKVAALTGAEIRYYVNPRNEDEQNELRFCRSGFLDLGLEPVTLGDGLLSEIHGVARKYAHRCEVSRIVCTSRWRHDIPEDTAGSEAPVKRVATSECAKLDLIGECGTRR